MRTATQILIVLTCAAVCAAVGGYSAAHGDLWWCAVCAAATGMNLTGAYAIWRNR